MIPPPAIQYTTTPDGKRIAYTVSGEGLSLVQVSILLTHQQLWMETAAAQDGRDAFASDFRFVNYDSRGSGLSTRGLSSDHSTEDWLVDLHAVIQALGTEPVLLMAWAFANHLAVRYALRHPERVRALILNTVTMTPEAQGGRAFWTETPRDNLDFFFHSLQPAGLDRETEREHVGILHRTMTLDDLLIATNALFDAGSIEAELGHLQVPTLVLFPRHFRAVPSEECARVAAAIRGSRFQIIEGDNGIFMTVRARVAAIKDFLASSENTNTKLGPLSSRELDVLLLLAAGHSNREIAHTLVISQSTVAKHVASIFAKTESTNRTEAAIFAHRSGVL